MEQFEGKYNTKSTSVKRLMREARELQEPTEDYAAHPLEDNLFEWHFTIRGPPETDFSGGVYHGRILLPPEYPMKPPNIILLTPNGRFEVNKKICLSISGHHPESWQPSWSIRTALLALIAFMPTPGNGTIGSLDFSPEERKTLASKSHTFVCHECGKIENELSSGVSKPVGADEKAMIECMMFKGEETEENSKGQSPSAEESVTSGSSTLSSSASSSDGAVRQRLPTSSHPQTIPPNVHGSIHGDETIMDWLTSFFIVFLVAAIMLLLARRIIKMSYP